MVSLDCTDFAVFSALIALIISMMISISLHFLWRFFANENDNDERDL